MDYTKGIWELWHAPNGHKIVRAGTGADAAYIGEVYDDVNDNWETDGRLIVAAPEMYEALKAILPYAEEWRGILAGEGGQTEDEYLQKISCAQKALAKAESR